MKLLKFFLGLCLGIALLIVPLNQFHSNPLDSVQTLAVQLDGRKKPLYAVANETVTQIHGRSTYTPQSGEKLDTLHTYLSLWFNDRDWNAEPFILFNYRPLKTAIGLDPERKYFTFAELMRSDLGAKVQQARQKQIADLDLTRDDQEALTIEDRLALMLQTVGDNNLPLIPHPNEIKGTWVSLEDSQQYYSEAEIKPIVDEYEMLRQTYRLTPGDTDAIALLANQLQQDLRSLSPQIYPPAATLQREVNFYQLKPFAKAWRVYLVAFCLMLGVLYIEKFSFYWGALGIFTVGLGIQGYGFLERMAISGRPPVTNMYESVIWVGFGVALLALIFELIYKAKYYLLAAAPLAVVCLLLADGLPAVLDPSIKPLVPVLRDNFWLSIHVPTITLSYACFALSMGIGHIILGHYLFAPQATTRIRNLSGWNYSLLQVGVLLLTTGIILGGIWAHFSWGRFWGWDPKETWALIALLAYLVPLHGRLVGWLSHFGMGVAAVVCFNAVLMAWYGVNFVLGTGLHSYGFTTGGSELLVASIVGLDLLFVLAATIRYKSSYQQLMGSQQSAVGSR
ncbi:MAG: cytochrome c biogenesis protein CcsA [Jaaginema sp. PMC 1079.18]|nr:cytochrome c biogenesis protein CcsA [Jaaginema sp. PMC 1080.18]MEC4849441.1 cytochrome c biogenesis protein CcsA [Jaaginema sp. PMC 1079.18]MEC4865460.1 cytochrome c biogenesis protein CcsA [Jaaginema sp. PMC 1078.18]